MRVKIYSFLLILVFSSVILFSGSKASLQIEQTLNYVDHGPIVIENDSELAAASSSGSGTEIDPYIIEGYSFTTENTIGITITGTTDFLEIRDCYFSYVLSCLSLYFTSHISFSDNIIEDCTGVISTGPSVHDIVINNNNISSGYNVFTLLGDNFTLTNNHMTDTMISDLIISTNNCHVSLNTFSGSCSLSCEVVGTVLNNSFYGGLKIMDSNNLTIANNLFQGNTGYGLTIESGSNNFIYQNDFKNNNEGGVQANDDGSSNTWYNVTTEKGNYWSDYDGSGTYLIDGSANSEDLHPLATSQIVHYITTPGGETDPTETNDSNDTSFFVFPVIIGLVVISLMRRKK